MFSNLRKNGLAPSNTFLLGKCYSTSKSVFEDFRREGFQVSSLSFNFDSHESYDVLYRSHIKQFLDESLSKIDLSQIDKIIILDDGGYLIHEINQIKDLQIPIVSIEQTSSGIHYISEIDLNIPVINVARSKAKLEFETPFIVEACLNRFFEYLPKSELFHRNVLILGCGAIGTEVSKILAGSCHIDCYDPRFHGPEILQNFLKSADVIFGCSGSMALKYSQYAFLKEGVILASLSSSDREFEAYHFRKQFPMTDDCKRNFCNQRITLLQSGFPLNFWGSRNNMPLEKIQITLALLQSAIYQAIETDSLSKGIAPIDEESERMILYGFKNSVVENFNFDPEWSHVKL